MDDDEAEGLEEEIEEREPQVTSSDPAERKLARKLRIERRLEAIRKLNMPEGEEEEEVIQKTLLQQQLIKSYELLEQLTIEGNEYVTNVRVANDSREADRREQEGINRENIIEQLNEEVASAEEQFNTIAKKWTRIMHSKDPLQIHEELLNQKEKCDELIKQKDEVIAMLRNRIRTAEINFAIDQRKQVEDIETLTRRIEKQVAMMRRAYRQELQLIEDVIMIERKMLIDTNDKRWEDLHKKRDQEELNNSDKKAEQLEDFEEMCTQLRVDHQERYRDTKIKLENDIEGLQQELEEIKTLALMNSEKLDYNYQVLKKREDENIIIKSQQKRKINKLQDGINALRKKIRDYLSGTTNEIEKLTTEVKKLQASVLDIEAKADHFAHTNDLTYKQVWDLNKTGAGKVLHQILTIDKTLYEQQLGLKWTDPEQTVLEKTDLPSYKSAMQMMAELFKSSKGEESVSKEKSTKQSVHKLSDKEKKDSSKLIAEGETMAHRRLLRIILKQIADKSGFLIEERLKEVLKPYSDVERTLCRVDSVFAALQIKRKEEIEILLEYFLPYTHCPICAGKAPLEPTESSEIQLVSHTFSTAESSDSTEEAPVVESSSRHVLAEYSFSTDISVIMSAIHQPDDVIDHIVSNIVDLGTTPGLLLTSSKHECKIEEEKPSESALNSDRVSTGTVGRSVKTSKSSISLSSRTSCLKRHPLVISSVYILRALRQFVSRFHEMKEGVITMQSRLMHKRSTMSRLMAGCDVEMYWDSYRKVFPPQREDLWNGLMFGLQKYHEILKDRKKLNDEVVVLRRQNMELKYLLTCYKKDHENKMKPPCALQREIPIKPTGL